MDINDYTPEEQERLKAISAAMESIRKLKVLAPKISGDETYSRWLNDDISNMETTLTMIETDMTKTVEVRKAPFKNLHA